MTSPTVTSSLDSTGAFLAEAVAIQVFSTLVDAAPTPSLAALTDLLSKDPSLAGTTGLTGTVTLLTNLASHIAAGKTCAQEWRESVLGPVHDLATGVQSYNITFQNMVASVLSAPNPTTQDAANTLYGVINKELLLLQSIGASNTSALSLLQNKLEALDGQVSGLASSYAADKTALATALTVDTGLLQQIEDQITSLNSDITRDIGVIAGGAASIAVGIGLCVLAVLVATETLGGGTPVAVGLGAAGVGLIVAGGLMDGLGGKDLQAVRDKLANATSELSFVQGLVTFFSGYAPHLASLATASGNAKLHAADVATTFASLETNLAAVHTAVTSGLNAFASSSPPALSTIVANLTALRGQLNTLAGSWSAVAAPLTNLTSVLDGVSNPPLTLPTKDNP